MDLDANLTHDDGPKPGNPGAADVTNHETFSGVVKAPEGKSFELPSSFLGPMPSAPEFEQTLAEAVRIFSSDARSQVAPPEEPVQKAGTGRPAYHEQNSAEPLELIGSWGVFNQASSTNDALTGSNVVELLSVQAVSAIVRDASVRTILPFAKEPSTVARCIAENNRFLGSDSVHPVSAGMCTESDCIAEEIHSSEGGTVLQQRDILGAINWEIVCEACGIPRAKNTPSHQPPRGSKALTMLAGVLALEQQGGLQDSLILFHDTDITNPDEYGVLPLIAASLGANGGLHDTSSALYIARTGPGRNNEGWTATMSHHARGGTLGSHEHMAAALLAARIVWPLTGERLIPGSMLVDMPWTTGMSIETQMNLCLVGREVREGRLILNQVCNPSPKVESAVSEPVREFALVNGCADFALRALTFSETTKRLPHEFDVADVRAFNYAHGGKQVWSYYQSNNHAANVSASRTTDFMLPSLRQMKEMGAL
jgi:hypothetical protein